LHIFGKLQRGKTTDSRGRSDIQDPAEERAIIKTTIINSSTVFR